MPYSIICNVFRIETWLLSWWESREGIYVKVNVVGVYRYGVLEKGQLVIIELML